MAVLKCGILAVLVLMGLLAGFFFAFSFIVMPGFDQSDPVVAIEAMQEINRAVRNAVFFVPFFLTPVFGVVCAGFALRMAQNRVAFLLLGASVLYGLGGMVLTMTYHVPMNETLALVDARASEIDAAVVWRVYSADWTPWNTVRTGICVIAMIPLAMAFAAVPRQTATG